MECASCSRETARQFYSERRNETQFFCDPICARMFGAASAMTAIGAPVVSNTETPAQMAARFKAVVAKTTATRALARYEPALYKLANVQLAAVLADLAVYLGVDPRTPDAAPGAIVEFFIDRARAGGFRDAAELALAQMTVNNLDALADGIRARVQEAALVRQMEMMSVRERDDDEDELTEGRSKRAFGRAASAGREVHPQIMAKVLQIFQWTVDTLAEIEHVPATRFDRATGQVIRGQKVRGMEVDKLADFVEKAEAEIALIAKLVRYRELQTIEARMSRDLTVVTKMRLEKMRDFLSKWIADGSMEFEQVDLDALYERFGRVQDILNIKRTASDPEPSMLERVLRVRPFGLNDPLTDLPAEVLKDIIPRAGPLGERNVRIFEPKKFYTMLSMSNPNVAFTKRGRRNTATDYGFCSVYGHDITFYNLSDCSVRSNATIDYDQMDEYGFESTFVVCGGFLSADVGWALKRAGRVHEFRFYDIGTGTAVERVVDRFQLPGPLFQELCYVDSPLETPYFLSRIYQDGPYVHKMQLLRLDVDLVNHQCNLVPVVTDIPYIATEGSDWRGNSDTKWPKVSVCVAGPIYHNILLAASDPANSLRLRVGLYTAAAAAGANKAILASAKPRAKFKTMRFNDINKEYEDIRFFVDSYGHVMRVVRMPSTIVPEHYDVFDVHWVVPGAPAKPAFSMLVNKNDVSHTLNFFVTQSGRVFSSRGVDPRFRLDHDTISEHGPTGQKGVFERVV